MYELKKNGKVFLRVNLLRPGPRLMKKRIYRAVVSQRLRNTGLNNIYKYTSYPTVHTMRLRHTGQPIKAVQENDPCIL